MQPECRATDRNFHDRYMYPSKQLRSDQNSYGDQMLLLLHVSVNNSKYFDVKVSPMWMRVLNRRVTLITLTYGSQLS